MESGSFRLPCRVRLPAVADPAAAYFECKIQNAKSRSKPPLLHFEFSILNYFLATFFLPATVLRLPLRVRLLVRVR